jgi:protein-S-isoprenylcysteine O-methyltransferase Ste14
MTSFAARAVLLVFGLLAYVTFLITLLAVIAFLSGFPVLSWFGLPQREPATGDAIGPAVAVDVALLLLFVVQHTIMARPAFKARWTRVVGEAAERSVFVLASSLVLVLLLLEWRPIAGHAWHLQGPAATALWVLGAAGWGLVLLSSFLIDHFELFGVKQVLAAFSGRSYRPAEFRERGPYRLVRHPLMLGFVVAFWACPVMTWDRLLFAVAACGYISLVGLRFEERDLLATHGKVYEDYRRRVPRLLPWPRPRG